MLMTQHPKVTIARRGAMKGALSGQGVDGILSYCAEAGEWRRARGPDPWEAKRLRGKRAIGDVLRARYAVIPDIRARFFVGPASSVR